MSWGLTVNNLTINRTNLERLDDDIKTERAYVELFKKRILSLIAYKPKDVEELNQILYDIENEFEEYEESLYKLYLMEYAKEFPDEVKEF